MNFRKLAHLAAAIVLSVCIFCQQTQALSLSTQLLIGKILLQILKPRFVPLPIPLPFPLKFVKHTKKAFPVPIYSHSLSAHQVGHSSYGGGYGEASGLEHLGGIHGISGDLSHISGHDFSHISSGNQHLTSSYPEISGGYDDLSGALTQISSGHDYSKKPSHHNIQSIVNDLNSGSDILTDDSKQIDNIHDDIAAIGGFDVLTDIDSIGEKKKWW